MNISASQECLTEREYCRFCQMCMSVKKPKFPQRIGVLKAKKQGNAQVKANDLFTGRLPGNCSAFKLKCLEQPPVVCPSMQLDCTLRGWPRVGC